MAGLRRIPQHVIAKLNSIEIPTIKVACGRCIPSSEMTRGTLSAVGVSIVDGKLVVPVRAVLPPESLGPVSMENIHGREIVHKDEPKIWKDVYLGDRPVYGDWSKGSFSLHVTKRVYRRSLVPPRGYFLQVEDGGRIGSADSWNLTFTVDQHFVRADPYFHDDLLFALSLLREVTGTCDVFGSDADVSAVALSRQIKWEIFPPGERDLRTEVYRRAAGVDAKLKERLLERAGVIADLKPEQYIQGTGLNSNYYGALFSNDLVVFENLDYGNATYVLYGDWERLSQLSRTEILRGETEYDRIVHGPLWADRLRDLVRHELAKRRRR